MKLNREIDRIILISAALIAVSFLPLSLSGCSKPHAATAEKGPAPAAIAGAVKESDLAVIKLTPEAEKRLGIELAPVEFRSVGETRSLAGEVVLPPDQITVVSAPVSGTLATDGASIAAGLSIRKGQLLYRLTPFLAPERDLRLQLERDVAAAVTKVEAARLRFNRAEQLLSEKAGSEKNLQQAREELDLSENELKAARARLEQFITRPLTSDTAITIAAPRDGMVQKVLAVPGQAVNSGAALVEVVNLASVWIRVPVYVGELDLFDHRRPARVDAPGSIGRIAKPATAPPTANPASDTADLYFELSNQNGSLRPGQKLDVTLAVRGERDSLVAPWSAVLHDTGGGTWIYENIAPHQYARRRVEISRVAGTDAILQQGPAVGAKIVKAGAAELFGTEFGAGK